MFIALATLIVFLSGTLLDHWLDKKKHPVWFYTILIILIVSGVFLISYGYFEQRQIVAEREKSEQRTSDLQESLNTSTLQSQELLNAVDSANTRMQRLQASLEIQSGIIRQAMKLQPSRIDTTVIVREESQPIRQEIVMQNEKTSLRKNTRDNLYHSIFFFRAKYPMVARDIRIQLLFDVFIDTAVAKQIGAIVENYGTKLTIEDDRKSIIYETGVLRSGNQIAIEIVAKNPITRVKPHLRGN